MLTLKTYRIILALAKEGYERRVEEWKNAHYATQKAKTLGNATKEELDDLKEKEQELHDKWWGLFDAIQEFENEKNITLSWRG